jgi:3-ketosteroid 9alpha-monooxygenase subunit A
VYQLRRWYEQFYLDARSIPADMVARHEFEVDTTRAVEAWEAEVAANLAARGSLAGGTEGSSPQASTEPSQPQGSPA